MGSPFGYGLETLWGTMNVLGLPPIEYSNQGCSIPKTTHPGLLGCSGWSNPLLNNGHNGCIPPDTSSQGRHPKDGLYHQICLYKFKTMPFGLKTAPQTYQRLMELVLSGLQWPACLIYLDDVIVYGKTFEEHLQRLSLVLQRFRQASLKLKPSKCHFFKTQVTFLGHLLTPDGVLPDPGNVEKITTWAVLTCVTDVWAVLDMGNYYHRFIRNYSKKMQPLIKLTKKDRSFEWTAECQESFDQLKEELIGPDIMAYATNHGEFILDTDASLDMVGAVLSQVQDGVEHVITYGSRTLSKPE